KGLIEYDDQNREIGIVAREEARLAELREGCLGAEAVKTHFADPAAAWDAAMALNDGGVGYLVSALEKVCRPETKARQIAAQLDIEVREIESRIGAFHVASDVETRLEEKRAAADGVIDALDAALMRNRFGQLHRALAVNVDAIADRIARVPGNIVISSAGESAVPAAKAASTRTRPERTRVRPGRGGSGSEAVTTAEPAAENGGENDVRIMSRERFQAESALEVWLEGMRAFAEDPSVGERFGMQLETAQVFVSEIAHAARRRALRERMMGELKDAVANFSFTAQQQSGPASLICAEIINRFIEDFDARALPEGERPVVEMADGTTAPVFDEGKPVFSADALTEEPEAFVDRRWTDWTHALFDMFERNALDVDGANLDIEQNMRLGEILQGLRQGGAPS
ncbi:MAG: virulence factor SrfC family protein, partial [Rubricella sp.]